MFRSRIAPAHRRAPFSPPSSSPPLPHPTCPAPNVCTLPTYVPTSLHASLHGPCHTITRPHVRLCAQHDVEAFLVAAAAVRAAAAASHHLRGRHLGLPEDEGDIVGSSDDEGMGEAEGHGGGEAGDALGRPTPVHRGEAAATAGHAPWAQLAASLMVGSSGPPLPPSLALHPAMAGRLHFLGAPPPLLPQPLHSGWGGPPPPGGPLLSPAHPFARVPHSRGAFNTHVHPQAARSMDGSYHLFGGAPGGIGRAAAALAPPSGWGLQRSPGAPAHPPYAHVASAIGGLPEVPAAWVTVSNHLGSTVHVCMSDRCGACMYCVCSP